MKIMILGLGVIGTTYGYIFQKAGFETEHFVREERRHNVPEIIKIKLLDGRNKKTQQVEDIYKVKNAEPNSEYDFILVSISSNKLEAAIRTLNDNNISGTILLFNGVWQNKSQIENIMGCRKYILGYPVAGGKMDLKNGILDCVIFDRFMLEREAKTNVENYNNILKVFEKSAIKAEYPYDMLEWIWIHMALNAGVISTAAKYGNINDPTGAARTLMESTKALKETILSIREAMNIIKTRGVKLKNYRNELLSYYMPSNIAAILMKKMFKTNELSRKIMELHSNKNDLFYVCSNVYNTGKQNNVSSVNLYNNYEMYISHLLTNIDA